jgi:hypothetical protein
MRFHFMRFVLSEEMDPSRFDVGRVVSALYDSGKISWNTLDVWNHMERSNGPVEGYIKNGNFHYREEYEKVVNSTEYGIDDEETAAILLIHRLLNEELRIMKED